MLWFRIIALKGKKHLKDYLTKNPHFTAKEIQAYVGCVPREAGVRIEICVTDCSREDSCEWIKAAGWSRGRLG